MNAEQKRAWFVVMIAGATCVGFVVLGTILGFRLAPAALGIFGLAGFTGLIGRGEKADERDTSIARRATLAGAMASYGAFILGCMGVWFVAFAWHRQEQVSVHVLGIISCMGMAVLFTARSVAVLVYYGRHVEAGDA